MHINEPFEKQAKSDPFARAVVHDKWIAYWALDKKAKQLYHYLRSNFKIKSSDVIALSIENKDINLLITILSAIREYFHEIDAVLSSDNDKIIREKYRQKILRNLTGNIVTSTIRTQIIIASRGDD